MSAEVAKRVCTTERSSAKSSTIASSAASAAGEPATAVIARVRVATARPRASTWSTSLVVPEREIATSAS